jgi:hypothetical protein
VHTSAAFLTQVVPHVLAQLVEVTRWRQAGSGVQLTPAARLLGAP